MERVDLQLFTSGEWPDVVATSHMATNGQEATTNASIKATRNVVQTREPLHR